MLRAVLLVASALAPDGPAPSQGEVVARARGGATLERAALEATLLERYAYGETGRELLDLLLKARLLDALAAAGGIRVGEGEVTRRWKELEKRSLAGGQALADEMQRRRLTPEQFREFLRLAILQERLTRAELGIPERSEVSGDQQEIWLQQEIGARGLEILPPARGLDGILARCGEVRVTRAEFATFLRERLGAGDVLETAWHLLLLRAIEQRMPDLAPAARERALDEELARRRRKHAAEFPSISFEQRLGATGRTLAGLRADPSVAIAALSRLWVDRTSGADGLRRTFEAEREAFEARYGEAVRAALLFRLAGRFVNDLCPRTFEQAEHELGALAGRLAGRAEFAAEVARLSEEPVTRKQEGDLGWVTRGDARVWRELREALFHHLETGGTIPEGGRCLGPVRLESGATGVALLWASEVRPSPGWEEMSEHVHEELRRRFLESLVPRDGVELVASSE
jgi:hypothetical protein